MQKMTDRLKKYTFVLPLLFILGLAYWRYTYILNPNFSGDQWLVNIRQMRRMQISVSSIVMGKSIIIYWVFFFMGNTAFFTLLFSDFKKVKMIGFLFLLISFFSASLFAIDTFILKSEAVFSLAAILKNFLLSPVFTAMGYLMIEYFHWFGETS